MTPSTYALHRAREAMIRHKAPLDLFDVAPMGAYGRRPVNMSTRHEYVAKREEVWYEMRQPDQRTGMVLSYPEIAAATTGVSHATIMQAVKRYEAKLAAGKAVAA